MSHKFHPLCTKSQKEINTIIQVKFKLVTWRAGATEDLYVGIDQSDQKTAERTFRLEVSLWVSFESLDATRRTEVIGLAVMVANQGVGISPGDLHPAHRVHNFFLVVNSHDCLLTD